jgi:hypothetical protein
MRKGLYLGLTASVVGGVVLLSTPAAFANHAQFPARANRYRVAMVRAMDQCTGGAVSVVGATVPNGDCLQANTVTDDPPVPGATMNSGTLTVSRTANSDGRVGFMGTGFDPGARLSIQLTLRTTQSGIHTKHPPGSNKRVTYQDYTVSCGNQVAAPGCGAGLSAFGARATGAVVGHESLKDCMTQSGVPVGLTVGNIEVLDASLVNCDTGKVIAKPGIKQGSNR